MRVISQYGNVDLPYEQIIVCHAMENVTALRNEKEYVLGKYSSQEKVYKAMEKLRNEFADYGESGIFQFPQDDEIEV